MKKTILIGIFISIFLATPILGDIGIVVTFADGTTTTECLHVEDNINAFEAFKLSSFQTTWSDSGQWGHALCKIDNEGNEIVTGEKVDCDWSSGEYWNFYLLNDANEWEYAAYGFDGPGICDLNQYCSDDGEVLGFIFNAGTWGGTGEIPSVHTFTQICGQSTIETSNATSKLKITDITFRVDDKKDSDVDETGGKAKDIKPGSTINVVVEVENQYDENIEDLEIDDIEIQWTAEDMDDGKNLEEEEDLGALDAEENDEISFEFEVPLDADEDTYKLTIEAKGEDENNTKHSDQVIVEFEIEKEKHELIITNTKLNYPTMCKGNNYLKMDIYNLGKEDEDDSGIRIYNDLLEIDETVEFELAEEDDLTKTINFVVENADNGVYQIFTELSYDKKTETDNIELTIDCSGKQEENNIDETQESESFEENEEVELVMLTTTQNNQQTTSATTQQAYASPTLKKRSTFEADGLVMATLIIVIIASIAAVLGFLRIIKIF
ncbi:hypothetical protein ACFL0W_05885 [Nanoarchaeota archaeon]